MKLRVHEEITRAALKTTGDLSADALTLLCEANKDADNFPRHTFIAAQHFDDCEIEAGKRLLTRAREELGYAPRYTLEAGLADWLAWLRHEGDAAGPPGAPG